jgi:hypothetical protein
MTEQGNVVDLDRAWFARHPDRRFRLRAATPAEMEASAWHMPSVTSVRAIVRKGDGAVQFAIESVHRRIRDDDDLLADIFRQLEDPGR